MKGWLPTSPGCGQPLSKNWRLPENMLPHNVYLYAAAFLYGVFPVIRQTLSCERFLLPVVWKFIRSAFEQVIELETVFPLYMRTLCGRYNRIFPVGSLAIFPGFSPMCMLLVEFAPTLTRRNRCARQGPICFHCPEDMGINAVYYYFRWFLSADYWMTFRYLRKRRSG